MGIRRIALRVAVVIVLGTSQRLTAGTLLVTKAGVAHDLGPSASRDARVHLVGTITYYDPDTHALFLEDETGGIYVNVDKPYPIQQGELVELDGSTDSSYRSEIATDPAIHVLRKGNSFRAPRVTYRTLASGRMDCRLVSIRGRVRDVDIGHSQNAPAGHMDVIVPGGEVEIYVHSTAGLKLDSLMDAEVEIKGVAGGSFDASWQMTGIILYVQNSSSVHILHSPVLDANKIPLTGIDDLLKTRYIIDKSERVRVRGTVTYYKEGVAAVLETQGKSIYVEARQTANLLVGDDA